MHARVSFKVYLPEGVTPEQAEEWVRYEIHDTYQIKRDNPLSKQELDPTEVEVDIMQ